MMMIDDDGDYDVDDSYTVFVEYIYIIMEMLAFLISYVSNAPKQQKSK